MQTMEERPTERGIEALKERMDERFDDVSAEFRRIDKRFDDVSAEFRRIDKRFENVEADIREIRGDLKSSTAELRTSIESLQRNMLYGFMTLAGIIVALAGIVASFQVF